MLTQDTSHLDYQALMNESKHLDYSACTSTLRVAVLSDAAVPQLVPLLKALLARKRIKADVYHAEYDSVELEVFNAQSGLYAFKPDAIAILNSTNALRLKYYRQSAERATFGAAVAAKMAALWDAIKSRSSAVVIQSNCVPPYERAFGNFDHKVPETLYSTVLALNSSIAEMARARSHVLINDVESLASYVGRRQWCDERMWTLCKAFCSFDHLPLVAQNVVDILLSNQGHVVKCVIVDLDNTLWGGVIGDDGMQGIVIGPAGDGEPFQRLQYYLLELKRRGIVLAVCSKNDQTTALEPFRSHPEMVLREEDIAVFVANWNAKPDNIRSIREALNIGYDSIVFLDDNRFERQLVRECLPEVIVPELPEDPSDYVQALSELNLFEVTSFSDEDRRRADLYRSSVQRQQIETQVSDITAYLRSLDMKITMKRFDAFHLPRIVQLLQRSNQFNLTTRRYNLSECEAMMADEQMCLPLYLKLSDKFGDNGLISVIILKLQPPELMVDSWLMSCRVLGRGVEQYAMNQVVSVAKAHGCCAVVGQYVPTAKNAMVKEFFKQFGFDKVGEHENGRIAWRLDVTSYEPIDVVIQEAA